MKTRMKTKKEEEKKERNRRKKKGNEIERKKILFNRVHHSIAWHLYSNLETAWWSEYLMNQNSPVRKSQTKSLQIFNSHNTSAKLVCAKL